MSLKTPRIPPFFFGFAASVIRVSVSESVQVVLVLLPELLALRHVPLPRRDLRHDVREQPERVDRRQHRDADQVTERHRSEEHTSELQSQSNLVCRLLLEKKKTKHKPDILLTDEV